MPMMSCRSRRELRIQDEPPPAQTALREARRSGDLVESAPGIYEIDLEQEAGQRERCPLQ
jgi:hypothetical protein